MADDNKVKDTSHMELSNEILCPNVQDPEIIEHLKTYYGLKVTKLTRLNGYDDCNFHVKVDVNHSNPNIKQVDSNGYFAKVSSNRDSDNPEILIAQLSAMRHLCSKGIPCQSSVSSLQNEDFTDIKATSTKGETRSYKVALRTFLPGNVLAKATLTASLLYDVGQLVSTVTMALQDFHHPFYDNFDHIWTLNQFPKVAKVTFAVKDEKRNKICQEVLKSFNDDVIPLKSEFRKGQVHGDINEQNLIVDEVNGETKITGLLDFQDMAYSYPVYDLALASAYMMTVVKSDVPRTHIPGYILAGYASKMSLNQAEQKAFHTLTAARMVQSLVYGAYFYYLDPTNEYLLETSKCGWDALTAYWETPKDVIRQEWAKIIEKYQK